MSDEYYLGQDDGSPEYAAERGTLCEVRKSYHQRMAGRHFLAQQMCAARHHSESAVKMADLAEQWRVEHMRRLVADLPEDYCCNADLAKSEEEDGHEPG